MNYTQLYMQNASSQKPSNERMQNQAKKQISQRYNKKQGQNNNNILAEYKKIKDEEARQLESAKQIEEGERLQNQYAYHLAEQAIQAHDQQLSRREAQTEKQKALQDEYIKQAQEGERLQNQYAQYVRRKNNLKTLGLTSGGALAGAGIAGGITSLLTNSKKARIIAALLGGVGGGVGGYALANRFNKSASLRKVASNEQIYKVAKLMKRHFLRFQHSFKNI